MGIKEERNVAKDEFRIECLRLNRRVASEINRRISTGFSRVRAISDMVDEFRDGNVTVLVSPPRPGSDEYRIPSVEAIRLIIQDLYHQSNQNNGTPRPSASSRPSNSFRAISPLLSPPQRSSNPPREVSMGNAVRNLGSAFGLRSPDYRRDEREAQNRRTWREESVNNLRMMADVALTQRRNTLERVRAANHLPPIVDDNIPSYQYNPDTFKPRELTLQQTSLVMSTFDFDDHHARIRNTYLQFSIKIRGMEPATGEELRAAVSALIRRYFKFQPVILMCARPIADPDDSSSVGVLFEKINSALRIFKNRGVLANTRYSVVRNLAFNWIIWNYDG